MFPLIYFEDKMKIVTASYSEYMLKIREAHIFTLKHNQWFFKEDKISLHSAKSNFLKNIEVLLLLTWFLFILVKRALLIRNTKNKSQNKTLFYSLTKSQLDVENHIKLDEFIEFLKDKRFDLNHVVDSQLVIESKQLKFFRIYRYKNIITARENSAVIFNDLNKSTQMFSSFCEMLFRLILYRIFIKPKMCCYTGMKEYVIMSPLEKYFNNSNIKILATTQSQLLVQPYLFFCTTGSKSNPIRLMFWYSTNNLNLTSKQVPKELEINKFVTNSKIDMNFVWNDLEKVRILNLGKKAKATGSILFRPKVSIPKTNNFHFMVSKHRHKIVIFDVTPKSNAPDFLIYNNTVLSDFIHDIVAAKDALYEFDIELFLKQKRTYVGKDHSSRQGSYSEVIKSLVLRNKLNLLDSDYDLYDLGNFACATVSIPLTSAGLVGDENGVPSAYYLPSGNQQFNLDSNAASLKFITTKKELIAWLRNEIRIQSE
jgi:hypothetical protein